ncbi:unnamed protein product [Rotaria socialis]
MHYVNRLTIALLLGLESSAHNLIKLLKKEQEKLTSKFNDFHQSFIQFYQLPVDSKQISSIASTSIVQLIVKALENTISPAYSYASRLVCHVNMYQQHQILSLRKMSKLASFQLQKSRIVDYSHLNQHDPDFDSDSDDSSGEEDEDTTGNCTDNEYSTENDEDYVSNHLFKVSSTTFQGMRVFDSINPTLA